LNFINIYEKELSILDLLINSCKKDDTNIHEIVFNTALSYGTVMDIDSNVYKTIKIDTLIWMAENLRTTKYRNGFPIGTTTPATKDVKDDEAPKYQWAYGGNESNVLTYGRLYTWNAIIDTGNICPVGWHIPSDVEWTDLTDYLGGENVAGRKLKETGNNHWLHKKSDATNESGFTGLPGGYRLYDGAFSDLNSIGYWWSKDVANAKLVWYRSLDSNSDSASRGYYFGRGGFSVRCIKDN
jgi:uncharacterized protein (TIGR02145 family)